MEIKFYQYDLLNHRGEKIDELMFRIRLKIGSKDELLGYKGQQSTKIKVISNYEVQLA